MSKKEVSTDWKAAMAKEVATTADKPVESVGTPHISLKHGRMSLQDKYLPDDQLECVILASTLERALYDREYDAEDTAPPDCFSLGESANDLVPHDNVASPFSDKCRGCPQAEFGTARQGKGPACKTRLRLLVMPASGATTAGSFVDPDVAILKAYPTSVVNFTGGTGYEKGLANQGLVPWAVRSLIKVRPHNKKMHEMTFSCVAPLGDDDLLAGAYRLLAESKETVAEPYTYDDEKKDAAPSDTKSGAKY